MGIGLTLILLTIIICAAVLFGLYMGLCSDNKIKMFSDPRYEERISSLEKEVSRLKGEK